MKKLPERTVFYHPLPRHKEHPTIPPFLDNSDLNGWEEQSANGKLIRIVLLALVAGKLGTDFQPEELQTEEEEESFIEEISIDGSRPMKRYSEGVNPISNGIVIDHICRGDDSREIREHSARIIKVMKLFGKGGEWISSSREEEGSMKGIIFRPEREEFSPSEIKKLAAIAPGCTLNIIRGSRVVRKLRLHMPPKVYKLDSVSCKNPDCISHPSHSENVPPEFIRTSGNNLSCLYCEKEHSFKEIWK